ncbi:MAG: MarR family winged helix-turn-helix transcriptional regulator [Candidatus Acidiferrales bacterium]
MNIIDKKLVPIPPQIVKESILLNLASAYSSVGKQLEQKTKCSQTRGFIMSTRRGGAALNQNQIAKLLGFDRTVVHRAIKTMIHEGLLTEKKAATGRSLPVQLTAKGNKYRENLVKERRNAEEKLRQSLKPKEISTLIRLLNQISEFKF